ncbi:hypothetical protein HYC85_018325 [Camellia sinensis]|uniref:Uncharacterized protein n=1 Tax=Camellia sinensis TaxID=4442 RepID=A0A7J7GXW7_CAMSI|nr:hypothetical protein HYC85_018325 [Camellia sinensis]
MQVIELFDVKLSMLGSHQLQNAATATCTYYCFDDFVAHVLNLVSLLENDLYLRMALVRQFQLYPFALFLTSKEAETLGLFGATILIDGAHTKEFAKALADTIQMAFPKAKLVLVVAMASDKDHLGFPRELFSGMFLSFSPSLYMFGVVIYIVVLPKFGE